MNKQKFAQKIFSLMSLYDDYVEHGFKQKHALPDFFHFNKSQQMNKQKATKVKQKDDSSDSAIKKREMVELAENILQCKKCRLYKNITKVSGVGNVNAKILVITSPVSNEEEASGKPMVGKAGDFFKKWMDAINIDIDDIFITNLLKCNPRNNSVTKEDIETCREHLDKQIQIIQPGLILSLGQLPLSSLKKSFIDINKNHGQIFYYCDIRFMPTFHPIDVLSNPALKKSVWEDLKKFAAVLKG